MIGPFQNKLREENIFVLINIVHLLAQKILVAYPTLQRKLFCDSQHSNSLRKNEERRCPAFIIKDSYFHVFLK